MSEEIILQHFFLTTNASKRKITNRQSITIYTVDLVGSIGLLVVVVVAGVVVVVVDVVHLTTFRQLSFRTILMITQSIGWQVTHAEVL